MMAYMKESVHMDEKVYRLDEHIKRLYESCYTLGIDIGKTKDEMKEIVKELIRRNLDAGFTDLHMRLQVTRGFKAQTGMHPTLNVTNASIVICVDQKPPIFNKEGNYAGNNLAETLFSVLHGSEDSLLQPAEPDYGGVRGNPSGS